MIEGGEAAAALAADRRSTVSRRSLARRAHFEQVSPTAGALDEAAFDDALAVDPDQAMALLAEMSQALDPGLRVLARSLAGRLLLDVARRGPARQRGTGRIVSAPYRPEAGDLDLEASSEAIVEGRAAGGGLDVERLRVRRWVQPRTAVCLLLDRSGSMTGRPLATGAVAAAAAAYRAPGDVSVLAFARDVVVIASQGAAAPPEQVVDAVLALRGKGTTDVTGALLAAAEQLGRSTAGRKIAVLLSDCRATVPGDVVGAAHALDELAIIAPAGDDDAARDLASKVGAAVTAVAGPTDVPAAFARVLG